MLLADRILAPGGLTVRFQPILQLAEDRLFLHGFECLARGPEDSNAATADVLFEYVRRKRLEPVVDRACVAAAIEAAAAFPAGSRFAVNVTALTLGRDPDFPGFLSELAGAHGIALRSLTVEIVEHSPCWDGPSLARALGELRGLGMRIALDDVGLGYSNYRMILDAGADYLKIDRYFVQGLHGDRRRRVVLESLARLAAELGSQVVAEGVEDPADLAVLPSVGIALAQGHLLGRPRAAAELAADGWTAADAATPRPLPRRRAA
jgi:EAL domain-containing protein (putative c-di-GMP-specific phosphodiesterase class I)